MAFNLALYCLHVEEKLPHTVRVFVVSDSVGFGLKVLDVLLQVPMMRLHSEGEFHHYSVSEMMTWPLTCNKLVKSVMASKFSVGMSSDQMSKVAVHAHVAIVGSPIYAIVGSPIHAIVGSSFVRLYVIVLLALSSRGSQSGCMPSRHNLALCICAVFASLNP